MVVFRVLGCDTDCLTVVSKGQIRLTETGVEIAAIGICFFVRRVQLDGLVIIPDGLLIFPQIGIDRASVRVSIDEYGV